MTITAKTLFDEIGQKYEDAYVKNPKLEQIVDHILIQLFPNSDVLDVGCGTGKPVADRIANAGHNVHGIDVSQQMVNIASSQVNGHFEKVDMTTFQPVKQYNAILSILSMVHLTHSQTYSMMFKFCDWLKKGGLLAVGTIPSSSLIDDERLYDASGKVVRHAAIPFMGRKVPGTLYTKEGWRDLFRAAGFEIQIEKSFVLKVIRPGGIDREEQYMVVAKKVVAHALMGPYPLPSAYRGPHPLSESVWAPFAERLVTDEFDAVLDVIKENKKVLHVGSDYGSKRSLFRLAKESRS